MNYRHTKNDPTDTCRWDRDPKNTTSMAYDRLEDDQYLSTFSDPKRYQKIMLCPFSQGGKKAGQNSPPLRQLDSCQQSVWHLQVETPGVGQTPVAQPWCEILHFISKGPCKIMESYTTENLTPHFCCPLMQSLHYNPLNHFYNPNNAHEHNLMSMSNENAEK